MRPKYQYYVSWNPKSPRYVHFELFQITQGNVLFDKWLVPRWTFEKCARMKVQDMTKSRSIMKYSMRIGAKDWKELRNNCAVEFLNSR